MLAYLPLGPAHLVVREGQPPGHSKHCSLLHEFTAIPPHPSKTLRAQLTQHYTGLDAFLRHFSILVLSVYHSLFATIHRRQVAPCVAVTVVLQRMRRAVPGYAHIRPFHLCPETDMFILIPAWYIEPSRFFIQDRFAFTCIFR